MNKINVPRAFIVISIISASLIFIASYLGLNNPITYAKESNNWAMQARGQDIGNIIALLPFTLSIYLLVKRSVKGFLLYLGCLFYFVYAYLIYAFFVHFNYLFLIYVAVLGFSFYCLIGILIPQNYSYLTKVLVIKNRKFASVILIIIGVLFATLWLSEIISALFSGSIPQSAQIADLWVNPIHVIDLSLVLPGMIITGILLLQRKFLGYLFASSWLFFSVLMGTSIVVTLFMELQNGNSEAIAPVIMVTLIVLLSLVAFFKIMIGIKEEK